MTKKFNAFTLAEVLITLGIIGVVAAMTMPTLINQTNGAQYRAAYKKALSAISQGVTLNVALNDISFADTTKASATTDTSATEDTTAGILQSRMNVVKIDTGYTAFPSTDVKAKVCTKDSKIVICGTEGASEATETAISPDLFLYFNDSSVFAFKKADFGCTQTSTDKTKNTGCLGAIDVNGLKGPNKVVTCDGSTSGFAGTDGKCTVTSPTDIYPVVYYDQTILPASDAASAVLYGK